MQFFFVKRSFKDRLLIKAAPIILIFFFFNAGGEPATASPGECGLDFLNITVGARSISTGHANYAGIHGPEAIFGNPSLLSDRLAGFASYQYLLMDTKSQSISANLPINNSYSFGVGVHIFDPGSITGYNAENQKTGQINAGDYLVRFAIAGKGRLNYGLSFSYYHQQLDNIVGQGYGFGFGLTYESGSGRISVSAENIGPDYNIGSSSAPLPSQIALSGWFPIKNRFINLSGDIIYNRESGFRVVAGIEYSPVTGFSLRAGSNNDSPVSIGLGYSLDSYAFDYSYMPSGLFGDRHNFSVTFSR